MSKKIILCFDGTNNHPRDAKQEREWFGHGDIKDNGITNILKLHAMFGGNLANEPSRLQGMSDQRSFYYSGVGTYGSRIQRMFNAGFSSSNLDIATIMHRASEDLRSAYETGDEIIITGFSRGAAIARKFASRLPRFLPAILDINDLSKNPPIGLLAVFDTVASIGIPNLDDDDKPKSDVVFEDHTISPYVREAVHLVSVDDRRTAFHPTLMNHESRVMEVWFPGAHSDVGGGFWRDGLSDITLNFMINQMKKRAGLKIVKPDDVDFDNLRHDEYKIDFEDLDVKPNVKSESHEQDRWGPISTLTLTPRTLRVNIDDAPSGEPVQIHQSVFERIKAVVDYRPKSLKGIKHLIINDDGDRVDPNKVASTEIHHGLYRYI